MNLLCMMIQRFAIDRLYSEASGPMPGDGITIPFYFVPIDILEYMRVWNFFASCFVVVYNERPMGALVFGATDSGAIKSSR